MRAEASGDALHAAALIDLLWPDADENSLDRSVSYLEAATKLPGSTTSRLNDLSAAYLRRAEVRQDQRDLLAALEHASRALQSDSADQHAAFNRALALQRLNLHAEGARAFVRAAELSTDEGWKTEARMRARADSGIAFPMKAVELSIELPDSQLERAARSNPFHLRAAGWDTLLPRWGEAMVRGDTSAARTSLALASRLAGALRGTGGDTSLVQAVNAIRTASEAPALALARGHAAFGRGRVAYERADYREAIAILESASGDVAHSPSLRFSLLLWKAISLAQSGPPAPSTPILEAVQAGANRLGQLAIAARAGSALATTLMRSGATEEALRLLRESERLHESIGEGENVGLTQSLQAVAFATLGDRDRSYQAGMRAVRSLRFSRGSVRLHNALYLLAEHALRDSLPLAALAVQREDVRVAETSNDPLMIAEARIALGRIEQVLGDTVAADGSLRAARAVLARAPQGIGKEWVSSDHRLAEEEGASEVLASAASREEATDSAITFFRSVSLPLRYLPALMRRAARARLRGDVADARRDLERVLGVVEKEVQATHDREQRAALLASAREASERLMLLDLAEGNAVAGLRSLERGRSGAASAHGLMQRPRAEEKSPILDIAIVQDTLFTWVITADSVALIRVPLSSSAWRERVARVRSLLELHVSRGAVADDLVALYETVVRPLESFLPAGTTTLTLVADGELADAPIAAFIDRVSGRYLVQRWAVRYATSLGDALHAKVTHRSEDERVLLVADPAFDSRRFPRLARLPAARAEVRDIAPLYARSTMLEDSAASFHALVRESPLATVVHVAAHARFVPDSPERSELVLAESEGTRAPELERLDLRGVRLVVLSACEAARAGGGRTAGFLGLVSALRRAGTASVVGGLWRIGDDEARALMKAFHMGYARSRDVAASLRAAQLALLESSDVRLRSPSAWAGYRVVGW